MSHGFLDELNIEVDDVGLRRPTLDEVFLTMTGAPAGSEDDDNDEIEQSGAA